MYSYTAARQGIATTASQPSPSTATARTTATIVTATAHTSSVRLVRVAAAARIRVLLAEKVLDILHFLKRGPSFIPGASFKKQALIWILASMVARLCQLSLYRSAERDREQSIPIFKRYIC